MSSDEEGRELLFYRSVESAAFLTYNSMKSISKMVVESMTYIDQINEPSEKLKLLNTLRSMTEGKVIFAI